MAAAGTLSTLSITKRVDVCKGKILELTEGVAYHARLGFFDPSRTARCVFVLEPEHMFSTPILESKKIWEDHYLTADIDYLHLDVGDLQHTQMVVAVDKAQKVVHRGFFLGARPAAARALIYILDAGRVVEVCSSSLYATTELVTETRFAGFPCVLESVDLFTGTRLLERVLETAGLKLEPNTLCKVICKGFVKGEPTLPVVEFWPNDDKTCTLRPMTYNRMVANKCVEQFVLESNKKRVPGTMIEGVVAHVTIDAKVNLHIALPEEDNTLAVCMDNFLSKLDIATLQERFPPLTRESARKGCANGTVYVAVFEDDGQLYRARIIEVLEGQGGVLVAFIDYGNMATTPFAKVFEAAGIDKLLDKLPPLVYETHLHGIGEIMNVDYATELLQSDSSEIRVCAGEDGGCNDVPLISVAGKKEDGTEYNLNEFLVSQGLARPPMPRTVQE